MKRNLTALWLHIVLLAAFMAACSETETDGPQTTGSGFLLSLTDASLQITSRCSSDESPSTRTIPSELPSPTKEQFHVTILPEGGTTPLYDGHYTEQYIPAVPGRYTVSASCGSNPNLGWDTPFYSGSVSATVQDRKPTSVTIPCGVANALISVRFTNPSLFNQLYSDYGVIVANGDQSVRITPEKVAQSAYLPAGSTDLHLTFSATLQEGGSEVKYSMDSDLTNRLPLTAGQHLILALKASNTGLQIAKIEVKQESVSATIPDSWLPTPKVNGFGTINYVETNNAPTGATLNYTASRPLQDMELTFQFEDPQYIAYNKSYILSQLTDTEHQELATLGLNTLPQLGTDTSGSLDFAPLIATLQTNAGTTTTNSITLRVKANDRWSYETTPATAQKVIVEKPEFSVSVLPGNIWTKEFTLSELSVDQVAEGKGRYTKLSTAMSYQFSADGQNWETLGSDRRKTGLTAATTYYIRGLYRGCVPGLSCQVKTYPETPLTNGSLDNYTESGKDYTGTGGSYGKLFYWDGWSTFNELTCDYSAAIANSNNSRSGTRPVTDAVSGNAVWIATIGWGYGAWVGNSKYFSPSQLFLGIASIIEDSYNDTKNSSTYGIDYDSHPSHLGFYYKYIPYDGDTSDITVRVRHDDLVLGSAVLQQKSSINSYTYVKLEINYDSSMKEYTPNKLEITFISGMNNSTEKKNINNVKYVGSQLFIDEVTLIYDK